MKTYKILIHHDIENGGFWAECPTLPGCASQGDTIGEVFDMMKDAISQRLKMNYCKYCGKPTYNNSYCSSRCANFANSRRISDAENFKRKETILKLLSQGKSYKEIGKELNLSSERIRQLHKKILKTT